MRKENENGKSSNKSSRQFSKSNSKGQYPNNHIYIPITIYLVNGFQLKGVVRGFDNFTIVLESDNKQQLVYKHAVSTIAPSKTVNINLNQLIEQEKES